MPRNLQFSVTLAVLLVVLSTALLGWWQPVDNMLRSYRFASATRPPTQTIAYIDIDGKSLNAIGQWPWPRRVYADLIERLIAADTAEIVVDIDFSVRSDPADDAALQKAIEDAGGYVLLASFLQRSSATGDLQLNLPLPQFEKSATAVFVNVPTDSDGIVRNYVLGESVKGRVFPSVATALTPAYQGRSDVFGIDFGINANQIQRISLADVLDGRADLSGLEGKQVIVGASALELRDIFSVPRYGLLPGALLHALAAETLRQDRAMRDLPVGASVILLLVLATILIAVLQRSTVLAGVTCAVLISMSTEVGAYLLQSDLAILSSTAVIHVGVILTALIALAFQLSQKGMLLALSTRAHAETQSVLDRVISDNFDGVVVVDSQGAILTASHLAVDMLTDAEEGMLAGRKAAEVLPEELARRLATALELGPDGQTERRLESRFQGPDGTSRILEYVITVSDLATDGRAHRSGDGRIACLTFSDITERRQSEEHLKYLAAHDPLTGALSRLRLVEMIDAAMADDTHRETGLTVLLLDLSRFKAINDSLGHTYGDAVLKQLVSRLRAADFDAIARLGGDSFAMMRPGIFSQAGMEAFCKSILSRVGDTYVLGEHRAMVGAKLGVTNTAVSGVDPETLISHADMALSVAKAQPGNTFAFFAPDMDERLREKQDMEVALRRALELNQFHLVYQPQIRLEDGELVGVEALVRWTHPTMGPIPPSKFIPVAEETGLIIELGYCILKSACAEARKWPAHIQLAVNVSPMQFEFGDLTRDVAEVLEETGLPASRLDIEITEGMLISNPVATTATLQALRRMGLGIALDDFGTGYSSLSYLGRLPVDKIKIDQSFVKGLPGDEQSGAIIRAVMTLSESLGKIVVAEGIENADQAWMLRLAGADIGQGYHFSRPLGAAELLARIARSTPDAAVRDAG